jgi:CheY-like chemotaxis protein
MIGLEMKPALLRKNVRGKMGNKKIAIIDDEPDIVFYLASALQDSGFEVCSATNANEGLKLIRSQRPDLVCLDILMPEETGCSLYRKIKEDRTLNDVRVLIISGLNMEQEMGRLGPGARGGSGATPEPDGYIEKPIDLPSFMDMIQELTA